MKNIVFFSVLLFGAVEICEGSEESRTSVSRVESYSEN